MIMYGQRLRATSLAEVKNSAMSVTGMTLHCQLWGDDALRSATSELVHKREYGISSPFVAGNR